MRVCVCCHAAMEEDMVFCPECGAKYLIHDTTVYSNPDSPVAIVSQKLFLDAEKVTKAAIVFANLSEKTVTACRVTLKCQDAFGDAVAETVIKYSDLMCDKDEVFGIDNIITLADPDTRSIVPCISKVIFDDGSAWDGGPLQFSADESRAYLSKVVFDQSEEQLRESIWEQALTVGEKIQNIQQVLHDLFDKKLENFTNDAFKKKIEEEEKKGKGILEQYRSELAQIFESTPDVIVPEGTETIPDYMFSKVEGVRSIHIPDSVTKLSWCIYDCYAEQIMLPETLTSVSFSTFHGCRNLKELIIPESVKSFYDYNERCEKIQQDLSLVKHGRTKMLPHNLSPFYACNALEQLMLSDELLESIIKMYKDLGLEWEYPKNCVIKTYSGLDYIETIVKLKEQQESYKQELSSCRDKLRSLTKDKETAIATVRDRLERIRGNAVPSEQKRSDMEKEIDELRSKLNSLGVFKMKEKKELQERINYLSSNIPSISEIDEERKAAQNQFNAELKTALEEDPTIKDLDRQIADIKVKIEELEKAVN